MPILEPKPGHTTLQLVKRYLERRDRALSIDCLNFGWCDGCVEPEREMPEGFDWATTMDRTRKRCRNDRPHGSKPARMYEHYMISPDPKDKISLDELRELSAAWLLKEFPDYEAVIICHDDNPGHILHSHIIINNTNLKTGRRLHIDNPYDLNRDLQELAKERGLSYFESTFEGHGKANGHRSRPARTLQPVHKSRAELRLEREGGYSWMTDIRDRVDVAKHLSTDEAEFKENLKVLGVGVSESKSRRHRPDWVYSLLDQPTRRVCGEKLGVLYGRQETTLYFMRLKRHGTVSERRHEILGHARDAVVINDLDELHELACSINVCRHYRLSSVEACEKRIEMLKQRAEKAPESLRKSLLREVDEIVRAEDFLGDRGLLPENLPTRNKPQPEDDFRASSSSSRNDRYRRQAHYHKNIGRTQRPNRERSR